MEFETLKKSHKKEILIGAVVFILIAIVLIVRASFAKYQTTKNVKIAEGTINYKVPDFKVMAMYKNDGAEDVEITTMPEEGYEINKEKSYCTTDNVNKVYNKVFTNEEGKHVITGLSKDSKCYIYFDKSLCSGSACKTILGNVTVKDSATSFTGVATTDEGVFKTQDDDGDTYYWRGAVTNNYVKFADKYWRIIRINGDGSIRMIYDGTSARANGSTLISETSAFNLSYSDNKYVGFKYTSGDVHGTGTESTILGTLNTWYTNNLASYESKIDENAGFCNDREPSTSNTTSNGSGGTGTTTTYYGAYLRILSNGNWKSTQTPTFKCKSSSDLFTKSGSSKGNKSLTYPIGLITADEVVYAGAHGSKPNSSYYLQTGQVYWTLSPFDYPSANVFVVWSNGGLDNYRVGYMYGMRPVINLKADVTLTGKGTTSDPYVVS